jgi:anti-sigma regulatory factor (Ser/Thr protein kinase)
LKKLASHERLYAVTKENRRKKKELRASSQTKATRLRYTLRLCGLSGKAIRFHIERNSFRKHFYITRTYNNPAKTIAIEGDFGLENKGNLEYFLNKSSEIIDFGSKEVTLDLRNCTRMWPSAVTMLCSLKQWVELSTWNRKINPLISSIRPNEDKVTSYLYHCGFNDYVGLKEPSVTKHYNGHEVVKIRRETKEKNVEDREDEILKLITSFTDFDLDQVQVFHAVILEIFLNVSEHGVSGYDNGWWVLAQYHPSHGLISVNIADNGIGIKNSLFTGPQKDVIAQHFQLSGSNDGELIRYATETQVSGALTAVIKEKSGILGKSRYPLGSKRGNGLDRIKSGCKRVGVELSILSHFGYIVYDVNGIETNCGTIDQHIFAGTLYHLNVPAKKEVAV